MNDNLKPKSFPRKITRGSSTVTIYRRDYEKQTEAGMKPYVEFTLAYYLPDGRRKLEGSADYAALRVRADEVLEDIKDGRAEPTALRASERETYARAIQVLKPTGKALDVAAAHFARAVEILGSDLVVLAAEDYVKRHLHKVEARIVSEAVAELLDEKRRQNKSDRHIDTLTTHLERFADSAQKRIATVTAREIDLFLDSLKSKDGKSVEARTRDNYADSIVTLFEWCKVKRYIPSDFDEHTRITRLDNDEDGAIEIYNPDELAALLGQADAKLIPFLAIGAFAGLRSSEIMRLDWADVKIENGSSAIVVQKGKVKKRGKSRRIVPMSENLKAWLAPHAKKQGPVWPFCVAYLYEMIRELAPLAKVEWKSNALRHSAISYRVAMIKNVPQIALESGNSPQMIDSNYRELVTEQDAQRWFQILPVKS